MTILKHYRIDHNISQEEMAKKLNCGLPSYRNYENGRNLIPHNVLAKFLQLRGTEKDLKLLEALEEFYDK